MRRRTVIAAAGVLATAGCLDRSGPTDDEENDDSGTGDGDTGNGNGDTGDGDNGGTGDGDDPTDVDATPPVEGVELVRREECADPRDATVAFEGASAVRIDGCVVGETGCHVPELAAADYGDGAFRVVVEAVDDSDPEEACTQALTERGYRVSATFEGNHPERVTVVHDDTHGRETVTTADRP